MRRACVVMVWLCLMCPTIATAQLAVADAPVLAAVAGVATVLKEILDETRRYAEELANWSRVVETMQAMAQLTTDVEALIEEIESFDEGWTQLADSGSVLCSIDEAVSWKGQALQWQKVGFALVRKVNRLLGRTIAVLIDLQDVIWSIVGPTSGAQSSTALLRVIAANLQQLQTMTGIFQGVSIGKDAIETILGIQLVCIHNHALTDNWGSYSR